MKNHKKFGLFFGLALTTLATLFMLHGSAWAATFTLTDIQGAKAYFIDQNTLRVVIGGQNVEFDGSGSGNITYRPKDPSLFCVPANSTAGAKPNPPDSYLQVAVKNTTPLSGTILSGGLGDPVAVPESNLYAGTNPQNCNRALPSDKSVTSLAVAPPGAIFTNSTIGNIKAGNFSFQDGANIILSFDGKQIDLYDKQPEDNNRNFTPKTSDDSAFFCTSTNGISFKNSDQGKDPLPITFEVAYYDVPNNNKCLKKTLSFNISNPNKIAERVLEWNDQTIESLSGSLSLSKQASSDLVYLEQPNDACGGDYVVILDQKGGTAGTLFQLEGGSADSGTAIGKAFPNCSVKSQREVLIDGTQGTAIDNNNGGITGNDGDTCAANSGGWGLAWLACPVLDAASGLTTTLLNIFEDQLSFSVNQLGSSKDPTSGYYKIHQSWSLIKDIASSLVVIVMLVMVLSQAISFGPFDAYTVRKLLPRLVAAVILMQISWPLFSWVVDLVNDIGRGLADIMYWPFGGPGQMDIWHLLKNAKLSNELLTSLNWAALVVGIALGVAFLFTMLGVAFVAIVSLFFAVLTLVFRKILIIMLLIFSPLALLAWILPGTERYFKLWRENFVKTLMMFPIVIVIIASGRIFAYVVGSQDNGQFLNLIFILVGFFGPLFILPRTFRWGGDAMKLAGNGIMKASSKVSEKPKKFLDSRQEEWSAERSRQSKERVASNTGFNARRPWRYPLDKFKSGDWDPTRGIVPKGAFGGRLNAEGSRRRQAAHDRYVEQGEKSEHEDVAAAEARLVRERQSHRARGGDHDLLLQAIADGLVSYNDPHLGTVQLGRRNSVERTAARRQLAKLGAGMNWRYLENYYQSAMDDTSAHGDERRAEMRKFFDDNVDLILPKLPHIYKSVGQAADADPSGIAQMHGVEIEAILSNLSRTIEAGAAAGATVDQQDAGRRAQTSLTTFMQNFQRAVEGSQRGGPQLENGALRAMKGFLEREDTVANSLLNNINLDERHGRAAPNRDAVLPGGPARVLPTLGRSQNLHLDAEHAPVVEGLRDSLGGLINPDGFVNAQAPPPAGTRTPAQPGPGAVRADGVINIPHDTPTGEVIGGTDFDIQAMATRAGGWEHLSNPDLVRIYNYRTGELKEKAAEQLRARGLMQ